MRESTSETRSSKAQSRAEHLVSRGSTLVHRYRFRARAMSVEPKSACKAETGNALSMCSMHKGDIFHCSRVQLGLRSMSMSLTKVSVAHRVKRDGCLKVGQKANLYKVKKKTLVLNAVNPVQEQNHCCLMVRTKLC